MKQSFIRTLLFSLSIIFVVLPEASSAHGGKDDDLIRTKSFTVGKGGSLDVSIDGGDVHVIPWDKDEVFIKARSSEAVGFDELSMTSRGNIVTIENSSRNGWGNELRLDINVPRQFDIDLRTSNGDLEVRGPLTGRIRGSTSAGDIILGDLGGSIDMTTSGGNIRTGDIQGELTLKTSGGDLVIGNVSGETDVSTSGGNIRIKNTKKALLARTSGGDVMIGDVGGDANVSTSGGNIVVGKVTASAKLATAGGDIQLDGATGAVKAKTAGGNLSLENISGWIDAKTAGGDIEAELNPTSSSSGGVASESRLHTASGNIRLYVPADAHATIKAKIRIQGRWRRGDEDYRIISDFPAETPAVGETDHATLGTFVLNGGGATISLETVNADIYIRKMGSRPKKATKE